MSYFMQGSARQLFQHLQGPMVEQALNEHFEKIIRISQKQHYQRITVCALDVGLVTLQS